MRHTLWHSGGIKQSSGGACKWCSQKVSPAQVPQGPCQEASTSGGRGAGLPGEENQVSQPKENEPRGQENHWIMSPFDCRRTPHSFRFHFLLHWRRYCRSWQQYLRWCPFLLPHLSLPLSSSLTCLPIFLLSFLYLPPSLPSSRIELLQDLPEVHPTLWERDSEIKSMHANLPPGKIPTIKG